MITREQFDKIPNCLDSLTFVATQPDLATAWDNCTRPSWLLSFARKAGIINQTQAVRIAIGEAEAVLPIWLACFPKDPRPQQAIDAAKAWLAHPSADYAADAAYAAYAAGNAADEAYAASAAHATAISAAHTAYAAAEADAAVANAYAYNAVWATVAYAGTDLSTFKKAQCNRIRAIIPNPFKE